MEWVSVVYNFFVHAAKDPSLGWVQLGIGMALALIMFAVYRKERNQHSEEREQWEHIKTQLQGAATNSLERAVEMQVALHSTIKQELAMSKEREKRAEEHAVLHESERNILIQAVSALTESMTALKTLLETTLLRPPKRRKP